MGRTYAVGDLVWARIKGHPVWPGQVMNTKFLSRKVLQQQRSGAICIAFFGDYSFGWMEPDILFPFEEHYEEKSKQKTKPSKMPVCGAARRPTVWLATVVPHAGGHTHA